MLVTSSGGPYDPAMLHTDSAHTRTLTVVLPEAEWRALLDVEPNAVAWLHEQVRSRLIAAGPAVPPQAPSPGDYADDEY